MIAREYGGGIKTFIDVLSRFSSQQVDLAFFAIQRRYQMENLRQYDESEWPEPHQLIGYKSRYAPDRDYYNVNDVDYFLPLGEWIRDKNIHRKREIEKKKKEHAADQRRKGIL